MTRENIVACELCFCGQPACTCCVSIEVPTFLSLVFAASLSSEKSVYALSCELAGYSLEPTIPKHSFSLDPQDVPHLFNCTAHPTTLTPESLWDRPVKTIRELSFLDPENLD